jgi:hypothetical protein
MAISRSSLVIAVTVSLLILCLGCATQRATANIPAGPNVGQVTTTNTIPAGPSVVTTKHFAKVP